MSVVTESDRAGQAPATEGAAARCARCATALAADQEWCLKCGAARTVIHRPGSWRIPVLVVGTVVLLFVAGFAIALANLSSQANRTAAAAATAAPPAVSTAPPSGGTSSFAGWPNGVKGWTVVLAASPKRATAKALAAPIRATGVDVGILDSSRHKAMPAGQWVVFSGHYPTADAARAQARALVAQGHPGLVRQVF
jgi:septal ring-binding cell division protein DamX